MLHASHSSVPLPHTSYAVSVPHLLHLCSTPPSPLFHTSFTSAPQLRGHGTAIKDLIAQPVPYPLYTTLMLMLSINLLITAYAACMHACMRPT